MQEPHWFMQVCLWIWAYCKWNGQSLKCYTGSHLKGKQVYEVLLMGLSKDYMLHEHLDSMKLSIHPLMTGLGLGFFWTTHWTTLWVVQPKHLNDGQPHIHSSQCKMPALSQSVTCVLCQKHCADHHLHPINTFPQVTINTFNQDAQYQRESEHDISLKERSYLEFHFSLNVHVKHDVSVSSQTPEPEKWRLTKGQVRSCGIRPTYWLGGNFNVDQITDGMQMLSRDNG